MLEQSECVQAVSLLHENLLWGPFEDGGDSYDSLSLLVMWEST